MVELYILFGLMIVAAVVAVEMDDLLSSVVCVSAVGLGLSMTFLILKAPDAAFTQLIVEILCLIILIHATMRQDLPFSSSGRWVLNTLITLLFILVFLGVATQALKTVPPFGEPLMRVSQHYLRNGFAQTGATNLVAAILQDYRAYDRGGEVAVLFIAFVGVVAILRKSGHKELDAAEKDEL